MFQYDFGDNWTVVLQVEEIAACEQPQLRCLDGAGQGPPDDIGGIGRWNEIVAGEGASSDLADAEVRSRLRTAWLPQRVRFSSATRRLRELRTAQSDRDDRRPLAQRIAAFVANARLWVRPIIERRTIELRFWIGTVEDGQLVLLGERDEAGAVGPCRWVGPFDLNPELVVLDQRYRFVRGGVPIVPLALPTRRLLDRHGHETLCFLVLVVVPPGAQQIPPGDAGTLVLPVAALLHAPLGAAAQRAIWLHHQPASDAQRVAGRALLLASFDPAIRAVLGLADGLVAVPLPAIDAADPR
ncbi:MAG TPA: hypothetical protein VFS21_03385 [Roseiflexaceae bacterium]|nr:hypothetical protein [Roseiflexaceae bacterium]